MQNNKEKDIHGFKKNESLEDMITTGHLLLNSPNSFLIISRKTNNFEHGEQDCNFICFVVLLSYSDYGIHISYAQVSPVMCVERWTRTIYIYIPPQTFKPNSGESQNCFNTQRISFHILSCSLSFWVTWILFTFVLF